MQLYLILYLDQGFRYVVDASPLQLVSGAMHPTRVAVLQRSTRASCDGCRIALYLPPLLRKIVETATPSSASLAMRASASSSLLPSSISPISHVAVLLSLLSRLPPLLLYKSIQAHAQPFRYFAGLLVCHCSDADTGLSYTLEVRMTPRDGRLKLVRKC